MAFVSFYMNPAASGASDLNSGSTTAAPTHTYGGGTFVRATNTYTVASGNPSTDGFVAAGDYVSVYTTSGRSVATFIMKVDSTTSTTIVGSASGIVYGVNTTVSETANASTLTIGGSWATPLVWGATGAAGGLGTFTAPQSTKVNHTGNQTLAASLTIAAAGATTAPLWFDGYAASPGDLDADTTNTLAKPIWTLNSTFTLTHQGAHTLVSNLSLVGNRSGTIWTINTSTGAVVRCRGENTSSNAAATAISLTSAKMVAYSWFKTPTTASTNGTVFFGGNVLVIGCVAEGSGIAGFNVTTATGICQGCIALNVTGAGWLASTGTIELIGCSVLSSGATVDGVKWTGTPGNNSTVVGCLFAGQNGGTAITNGINASATTNLIFRACNDYYNVTNAEVNLGDSFAFFPQTDSAFPIVSATNLTPVATSNAWRHGFPGVFENETFSGLTSIGAVNPVLTGLWIS